jgi:hypothetical protein
MKKVFSILIALAWSLSVFAADGNGQVGSVGSPTQQSAQAIEKRMTELRNEMNSNPTTERMIAIGEEMSRLAAQYIAMLPKTDTSSLLPQIKVLTFKADKILVTPDQAYVGGTYSKIRLTAEDADVDFEGDFTVQGMERHEYLNFSMYRLKKGATKELDLSHDEYSQFSHRWELKEDMYISKLQFQISSPNLTGSRGKLKIELIP